MGKKIIKEIKSIISYLIDIVYPAEEKCVICDEDGFIGICPFCKSKINKIKKQDEILSYGYYGGILKDLILSFKYNKNFTAGKVISELLLTLINEEKIECDMICYVPMTKKSIKKRGFNQCEIIAKYISENLNIPVSKALIKVKNTKEQKTLSKKERENNIKDAFIIKENKEILKKSILLVDDVITTGTTLLECKKILEKNGVEKITILTIAKSHI